MSVLRNARPMKAMVRLKIAMVNQTIPQVAEDSGSLTYLKVFLSNRQRQNSLECFDHIYQGLVFKRFRYQKIEQFTFDVIGEA